MATLAVPNSQTNIEGPANLSVGKWKLTLHYDDTLFIAQRWANVFGNSGLYGNTIPGRTAQNIVMQQFSNGIYDALDNWFRKDMSVHGAAIFHGANIEWKEYSVTSDEGSNTLMYPKSITVTFEILENPLWLTAVIIAGIYAAIVTIHAIFPEASRAVFENVGGLFGDVGGAAAAPLKAIGIPIAIAAVVLGVIVYYSGKGY